MEIIDRSLALDMGLPTYFTNKICANGHLSYRYTQSGACSECVNGDRTVGTYSKKQKKVRMLKDDIQRYEFKIKNAQEIIDRLEKEILEEKRVFITVSAERKKILKENLERKEKEKIAKLESKITTREYQKNYRLAASERKEVLKNFVKFNEPIHINDVTKAKALLTAYAIMRCEHISEPDLWLTVTPEHGVLYTMKAHRDDIQALREQLRKWYADNSQVKQMRENTINSRIKQFADTEELAAKNANAHILKLNLT